MSDRPILFSAPMIRALLAGTKTQTRRLHKVPDALAHLAGSVAPRFKVGDRLWVRESFRLGAEHDAGPPAAVLPSDVAWKEADGAAPKWTGKLRPGIHMPRWASRLTLHVTEVRVQRLQEISVQDAIDEGIEPLPSGEYRDYADTGYVPGVAPPYDARGSYATLWASINGVESWAANPWVVAVSFLVEKANIERASRAK